MIGLVRARQSEAVARSAQQEERIQRQLAEQVIRFLVVDVLRNTTVAGQAQSLDRSLSPLGKDATIRTLMDRAGNKLLVDQSLDAPVKAQLLQIVGVSYRNIGQYKEAEQFLQAAVDKFAVAQPADTSSLHKCPSRIGLYAL